MVPSVTEQLLGSLVTSSQQPTVFQLVSSLVLHTVTELSLASQDTVLVEAWVTHPQDKSKRRKTVEESLPVLSSQVVTINYITTMFMTIKITLPGLPRHADHAVPTGGRRLEPADLAVHHGGAVPGEIIFS